jgi:hypothetical protein
MTAPPTRTTFSLGWRDGAREAHRLLRVIWARPPPGIAQAGWKSSRNKDSTVDVTARYAEVSGFLCCPGSRVEGEHGQYSLHCKDETQQSPFAGPSRGRACRRWTRRTRGRRGRGRAALPGTGAADFCNRHFPGAQRRVKKKDDGGGTRKEAFICIGHRPAVRAHASGAHTRVLHCYWVCFPLLL